MRIAFLYDMPYPWHKGGIEQMMTNEAKELAKENEVHFFTMRLPGMEGDFTASRIRYHAGPETTDQKTYRNGRRTVSEAFLYSLSCLGLFRYDFDAVVTDIFPVLHLPIVRLYCALNGRRLVLKASEVWDEKYWKSYLGAFLGMLAYHYFNFCILSGRAGYVANTHETARKLEALGIPASRIEVFAPVIDNDLVKKALAKYGRGKREKRVIFSGRLIKEKSIEKWIDAFFQAYRHDSSLRGLIIGEGPEAEPMKNLVGNLGLGGKIEFRNFYSDKMDLYREILKSAVMLQMSEREGLSIITLESLALNTPVILPKYTPIPEDVKRMCVVEHEADIPKSILEIIYGRSRKQYIRKKDRLRFFSTASVKEFYKKLLDR